MSTEEQQRSGSVPHAFRNALFWRWTREMPRPLADGFLKVLQALGAGANGSGKLKFRDGKPIRIKDIAAAAIVDEKDCRRYLDAAIAAGLVSIEGERKRGKAALYVLVLDPTPDWAAAVAALDASKRKRAERKPPPWQAEKNGGRSPELEDAENGGPPPELPASPEEEERGTAPRMGSGDRPPFGSGDRPPNNPGIAKELPHDAAEVVAQPQVDPDPGPQNDHSDHEQDHHDDDAPPAAQPLTFTRCATCHERMVPRPGRDRHTHCHPAAERKTA
ncbi:hypothetical protein LHJ74_14495 [Streptomyces sp. N2-109]|uniref:Uncharacterized protein n=1 Tax=Streptomyces gossypii TaxID=2883101 RepID=A0ABT2JT81_9ACTN|nr:hypothetical protein [Streptomyces gossypii]MCT2591103.1 hypothetical protein [Streptomyces gossypii]